MHAASGNLIADRRFLWGLSLAADGDHAGAAELYAQAVEAAPGFAAAWHALGEAYLRDDRKADALAAFRHAQAADPDDACGASLWIAQLSQGVVPMPPAYVRTLFDQYAPRFEAALRTKLDYCGPELLHDAVTEACAVLKRPLHFGALLDIGCGTGLGTAAFRAEVDRAEGFDIAPAMVEQAAAKNLFDAVHAADMADALARYRAESRRFDLVLAADVFPYTDDLAALLPQIAAVMAPGALLAFTAESHGGDGVLLRDTLRFAHGRATVAQAIAAAGLRGLILRPAAVRRERSWPVEGLVAVALRPERAA